MCGCAHTCERTWADRSPKGQMLWWEMDFGNRRYKVVQLYAHGVVLNRTDGAEPFLLTLCTNCSTRVCRPHTSNLTVTSLYEHMIGSWVAIHPSCSEPRSVFMDLKWRRSYKPKQKQTLKTDELLHTAAFYVSPSLPRHCGNRRRVHLICTVGVFNQKLYVL